VLRPLDDAAVDAQEIRALEGLEAKVVVVEVAVVDDLGVELLGVLLRWFFGGFGVFFFFLRKSLSFSLCYRALSSGERTRLSLYLGDDLVDILGDERGALAVLRVDVVEHELDAVEGFFCVNLRERERER
jgi:hypothetical protein